MRSKVQSGWKKADGGAQPAAALSLSCLLGAPEGCGGVAAAESSWPPASEGPGLSPRALLQMQARGAGGGGGGRRLRSRGSGRGAGAGTRRRSKDARDEGKKRRAKRGRRGRSRLIPRDRGGAPPPRQLALVERLRSPSLAHCFLRGGSPGVPPVLQPQVGERLPRGRPRAQRCVYIPVCVCCSVVSNSLRPHAL